MSIIISCQSLGNPSPSRNIPPERLEGFTQCVTEKGWVMYSSFTCPACRAQQQLFGQASTHLKIIECNPHAPNTQVELCLQKKIRYTPTWVREESDTELKRFKGYKKLEDLVSMTGCSLIEPDSGS
jgi:hypothetical protein